MELLLFIIASFLKWVFAPVLYIFGSIASRKKGKKQYRDYQLNLALAKDQYGNAVGQYMFNCVMITKEGYKFGNRDETISSVIGKNKVKGTLTGIGRALDYVLNVIDPNHSIKSIDHKESDQAE